LFELIWFFKYGKFAGKDDRLNKIYEYKRNIFFGNSVFITGKSICRGALNIWRSNAKDAGTFDQNKFDEFKKKIYEKSVNSNLKCIEKRMMNENYTNAEICLYWWKTHSQVLDTFDPVKHDELKKMIEEGKEKKKQLIKTNQESTK